MDLTVGCAEAEGVAVGEAAVVGLADVSTCSSVVEQAAKIAIAGSVRMIKNGSFKMHLYARSVALACHPAQCHLAYSSGPSVRGHAGACVSP